MCHTTVPISSWSATPICSGISLQPVQSCLIRSHLQLHHNNACSSFSMTDSNGPLWLSSLCNLVIGCLYIQLSRSLSMTWKETVHFFFFKQNKTTQKEMTVYVVLNMVIYPIHVPISNTDALTHVAMVKEGLGSRKWGRVTLSRSKAGRISHTRCVLHSWSPATQPCQSWQPNWAIGCSFCPGSHCSCWYIRERPGFSEWEPASAAEVAMILAEH